MTLVTWASAWARVSSRVVVGQLVVVLLDIGGCAVAVLQRIHGAGVLQLPSRLLRGLWGSVLSLVRPGRGRPPGAGPAD